MKTKGSCCLPAFVVVALVASIGTAIGQTEILTFDNLPSPGHGFSRIPDDYGGLEWQNFGYLDGGFYPDSGYANATVSPDNVAFNFRGGLALTSERDFNLNSAYLTGAWNDDLQVEVQGFDDAILIYDNIYTINTTGPTLINFNYLGVDAVDFTSFGGIPNLADSHYGSGTEFAMDNLSITMVPEPSTSVLIGLAVVMLLIFCRLPLRCPTLPAPLRAKAARQPIVRAPAGITPANFRQNQM